MSIEIEKTAETLESVERRTLLVRIADLERSLRSERDGRALDSLRMDRLNRERTEAHDALKSYEAAMSSYARIETGHAAKAAQLFLRAARRLGGRNDTLRAELITMAGVIKRRMP